LIIIFALIVLSIFLFFVFLPGSHKGKSSQDQIVSKEEKPLLKHRNDFSLDQNISPEDSNKIIFNTRKDQAQKEIDKINRKFKKVPPLEEQERMRKENVIIY